MEKELKVIESLPQPSACRVIDFKDVEVVPGFMPKTFFLIVSGTKPMVSMKVDLVPLVYIRQPEYWGIEVVACQTGIGLPQTAPYHVSLDISHLLGTRGIEVIGATGIKRIDVP
jgi:hypothetical protein